MALTMGIRTTRTLGALQGSAHHARPDAGRPTRTRRRTAAGNDAAHGAGRLLVVDPSTCTCPDDCHIDHEHA